MKFPGKSLRKLSAPMTKAKSFAVLLSVFVIACGGAGDVFVAGIEGTGITSGFGSVFVNGRELSTNGATIIFNGEEISESALRVGDVVTYKGYVDARGQAVAERIEFVRVVDGPVQAMDIYNGVGTVTTLGQVIQVDEETNFINTSPEDLAMGDLIGVSGLIDAQGLLRATSLEGAMAPYQTGTTVIEADGVISNLDSGTGRFNIGDLTVEIAGSTATGGALQNGAFVEVFGTQSGTGMPLVANTLKIIEQRIGEPGERVEIDSIVCDFNGLSDFTLGGQPINAGSADRTDTSGVEVTNGTRVLVTGELRSGVVVAQSLTVFPPATTRYNASVDSVSDGGFSLLGRDAQTRDTTQYIDIATNLRTFRLDDLVAGNIVSAQGYRDTNGQFVVTRLKRVSSASQSQAQVRGRVEAFKQSGTSLVVEGVTVRTDSNTQFSDAEGNPLQASEFLSGLAVGTAVSVTGTENANEISPAQRVQRLDSDA